MNETGQIQYQIDFRTGYSTAIIDDATSWRIRSACSALNRQRTRGILEAAKFIAPGEQIQTDVWAASFEREAQQWDVPLINLSKLGISHDRDGLRQTDFLTPLKTGAEAAPYLDDEAKVVYKLFDLKTNGALGKKIVLKKMRWSRYCCQ